MHMRPKFEQAYWYIGQNETEQWTILQKINVNDWEDQFHIAMKNTFPNHAAAEASLYEMLQRLVGEDAYEIWQQGQGNS